jgi:hypothetical protein
MCAYYPELSKLFAHCRASKATRKRHKTEWIMPRSGTWWVFKGYLAVAGSVKGIKMLCKRSVFHCVVFAVLRTLIPRPDLITDSDIYKAYREDTYKQTLYRIYMRTSTGARIKWKIERGDFLSTSFKDAQNVKTEGYDLVNLRDDRFYCWRCLLYEVDTENRRRWNNRFLHLMSV